MKTTDIGMFKLLAELRKLGWVDDKGHVLPEVIESAKSILKFVALLVAIPAVAAAITTIVLAGGVGSTMLLWWVLFV